MNGYHSITLFIISCIIASAWIAPAKASESAQVPNASTPADPIVQLQRQIDAGRVKLKYDQEHGYLKSLLKKLKVPESSQGLVFSKTSFQFQLIGPQQPRALYFNDDAYIGYVRGAPMLEIASIDPKAGTVFYVLKQEPAEKPKFVREQYECMQCHESASTRNVPGLLMRSVYPNLDGQPIQTAGTFVSTDRSPLSERWGGWYVTGNCGKQHHMGNAICENEEHPEKMDFAATSAITSLAHRVDTRPYLRDTSDVVALMVLAHQTHVHNLIASAGEDVRSALRDSDALNLALGQPGGFRSESTEHRIRSACEPLVRALLFSGEARLDDAIEGTSGFAAEFSALGVKDSRGRSLRDFDLKHRLFKYPCSYLIHSSQFDALPPEAKSYVYRRLWQVLTGREDSRAFDHLSDEDRQAIMQILLETKKDLPAYWRKTHGGAAAKSRED